MKFSPNKTLFALALAGLTSNVMAHGYISAYNDGVAAGRAALCKVATADTKEKNINCGSIQWEPQSVEGPEGFPAAGPVDGKIASAQSALATALDQQTADRWVKRPITAGVQSFEWTFTAAHVTRDWKYYITKPDWNPNAVLSRSSFDLTPFCVVDGGNVRPPAQISHDCNVPSREGYHVILAVWDVADTAAAFYNVIDVQFDGTAPEVAPSLPTWGQNGQIIPSMDLNVGDTVYTRVFDQYGENSTYRTELYIANEAMAQAKNWAHALATKINAEQSKIQAGQYANNVLTPVYGVNPIFVRSDSGINSIEIGYQIEATAPVYGLTVEGLAAQYTISDYAATTLDLTLVAQGDVVAELAVYNAQNQAVANWSGSLTDGAYEYVALTLSQAVAGDHTLVTVVKDKNGNMVEQKTESFKLVADAVVLPPVVTPPAATDYDFVFPNGFEGYNAGTKVLGGDGNVYQCKPFPFSGYCKQWSPSATHYTPVTGSHWEMAWERVN